VVDQDLKGPSSPPVPKADDGCPSDPPSTSDPSASDSASLRAPHFHGARDRVAGRGGDSVDIPIGLPETPLREADRAARDFVGERRSRVFATFPSVVLEAPTYEEAKAICVARGWPKPSIQSYGMRHRIFEIARLAAADERVLEVHPEVSFRELLGRTPSPKRTGAGASERRLALADGGIDLPDLPPPLDDVLDAAVVAWSAVRYADGKALPLPHGYQTRVGAVWR
jgi:predicted RNase H-like nuclease